MAPSKTGNSAGAFIFVLCFKMSLPNANAPATPTPPIQFISNQRKLEDCASRLADQPSFSFDLEFDRDRYFYGFTLALVQLATPEQCFVIDPLEDIDLESLYLLFENPDIQKLMHSGGEDIRLLHALQCYPKNLYDTEIPARLLNIEQTSLAASLKEVLGIELQKDQQKSNWLKRPLSREQVQYAANDVLYLYPLQQKLEAEIKVKGLTDLLYSEEAALSLADYTPEVKTWFLKKDDERHLSPYDQHILNALFVFRDKTAQELNKPAYQVMDEQLLRGLAFGDLAPEDLPDAKGLHHRLRSFGFVKDIKQTLQSAKSFAATEKLPTTLQGRTPLTPEQRAARDKGERDKEVLFLPIQQALGQRLGQFAARYLLSNGMVGNIVTGRIRLSDLPPARQALIRETAAGLGLEGSLAYYQ